MDSDKKNTNFTPLVTKRFQYLFYIKAYLIYELIDSAFFLTAGVLS